MNPERPALPEHLHYRGIWHQLVRYPVAAEDGRVRHGIRVEWGRTGECSLVFTRQVRGGPVLDWLPFAMMIIVAMADLVAGPSMGYRPLLSLGPAFASLSCGIRRTAMVGLLAVALCTVLSFSDDTVGSRQNNLTFLSIAGVTAAAMLASRIREHGQRELADMRMVAEAAQRVLLRPVPRRVGPVHAAVCYISAAARARIGGDLYEIVAMPRGVRLIVGDVQGKGLDAVETAAVVLGAFREAAHDEPDLAGVARRLETALGRNLTGEQFVTAVLAEVRAGEPCGVRRAGSVAGAAKGDDLLEDAAEDNAEDAETGRVALLNCGHPAPLVVRADGGIELAEPPDVSPPLGMAALAEAPPAMYEIPFAPGDQMLLYTDGVIEARDGSGAFYPLTERAHLIQGTDPEEALDKLRADLTRHVGSPITDDAAMLLLRRRDH
jgi:serine phosphatase RsbU (regulator of sigma subunit)